MWIYGPSADLPVCSGELCLPSGRLRAQRPPIPTAEGRGHRHLPLTHNCPRLIDLRTKRQKPHFPQQMSLLKVLCKLNFYKSNHIVKPVSAVYGKPACLPLPMEESRAKDKEIG